MTASPVWFITGCSTGFGREIAKLVLAKGWPVVMTARRMETLIDRLGRGRRDAGALVREFRHLAAALLLARRPGADGIGLGHTRRDRVAADLRV
ncbi:hypothetical protein [Rhodovulum kholense]|uniref:hypothetical protein n=1 Tax=Rhodovulum kholense TaxID=453584 RepID=UPI001FE6D8F6|nr:hypothetical protein [Rhodovulum kholense]